MALIVRLTARASAAAFVGALLIFAASAPHRQRSLRASIRMFGAFVLLHSIHFGAVLALARATASATIDDRGGWPPVLAGAAIFYLAVAGIARAWRRLDTGRPLSGLQRLAANVAVVFIAAAFLNSYMSRVGELPVYWAPAALMATVAGIYLLRERRAAATRSPRTARAVVSR